MLLTDAPEWHQTLGTTPLLLIALAAVVVILDAGIVFRLHAFITLIFVSVITAFATGIPPTKIVETLVTGFGTTLGSVALLVGLGAMLGKLVEASGGARVLADAMIRVFGEKRAPVALGVTALLMGFPIFFDAGLVVMLPIIFAVAKRLRGNVIAYAIPAVAGFSVMHILVPPHPGPVGAATILNANIGVIMIVGLIVAIPSFYVSGVLWSRYISRHAEVELPTLFGAPDDDELPGAKPKVGEVILMLILPALLVFMNTGLNTLVQAGIIAGHKPDPDTTALVPDSTAIAILLQLGQTPIALLISTMVATFVMGRYITHDGAELEKIVDSALGPVCSVILITGAGGMFGKVLQASGIGDAVAQTMDNLGVPLLLATYLVAVVLRLAQGSATVALLTATSLVAPAVASAGLSPLGTACIVLAASAGSVFGSHVNDSGFWLVGRLTGMDVKTTLKVWTTQQTIESVCAFAIVSIVFIFA